MDEALASSGWRVLTQHFESGREAFNLFCVHLEAWQIASYTLSAAFFVLYLAELASSERPITERIRARVYHLLRTLPWVKRRIQQDLARAKRQIEEEVHEGDLTRDFIKFLPERGLSNEEVLSEAALHSSLGFSRKSLLRGSVDPQNRSEREELNTKILRMFGWSDARDGRSFPGGRKMEAELVRITLSLFHADSSGCGVVVPSSSEGILVALSSLRSTALRKGIRHPSVLAANSASPALFHAAALLGIRVDVVACRRDGCLEAAALKRAIRSNTLMIFVSAPNHLTGTMDPIEAVAKIGQRYGIHVHVDCSVGGFILPFLEMCDYPSPSFDFRLAGISSISIDLGQSGQSASSCAAVLFRDHSMLRRGVFVRYGRPGNLSSSVSLSNSLDGAAVAIAWSSLLATGRLGFVEMTQRIVEGTARLAAAIAEIPGVSLVGSSNLCIVAFELEKEPEQIFAVVDAMRMKEWPLRSITWPAAASVDVTLELVHEATSAAFIVDLETVIVHLLNNPHLAGESGSAAFHRLVDNAGDRWLVEELGRERALAHYSMPPPPERRATRSMSLEGRKVSRLLSTTVPPVDSHLRKRQLSDAQINT